MHSCFGMITILCRRMLPFPPSPLPLFWRGWNRWNTKVLPIKMQISFFSPPPPPPPFKNLSSRAGRSDKTIFEPANIANMEEEEGTFRYVVQSILRKEKLYCIKKGFTTCIVKKYLHLLHIVLKVSTVSSLI